MKSKIRFDLTPKNEAVVTAEIIFDSDDLRDKVARQFHENLGHNSNLAVVCIQPETQIHGLELRNGKEQDVTVNGRRIQIETFGASDDDTLLLCEHLCTEQLLALWKVIPKILEERKKGYSAKIN